MQVREMRKGGAVIFQNEIHLIADMSHRTPGNKRAVYQVTLKNMKTGRVIQNRFSPDDDLPRVVLDPKMCQFLYKDDMGYHFMDMETYHSFALSEGVLGDKKFYLKESMEIKIDFHDEQPVFPEVPPVVVLKVTEALPGVKGDSVSNNVKPAVCETGFKVNVPLFVNQGDDIKINTDTGEYTGRA